MLIVEMSGDTDKFVDRSVAVRKFAERWPAVEVVVVQSKQSPLLQFPERLGIRVEATAAPILKAATMLAASDEGVLLSAGDTKKLVAAGYSRVELMSESITPCLAAVLPKISGQFVCADVGGGDSMRIDRPALEWAALSCRIVAEVLFGVPAKVGLLNIGEEKGKGGGEMEEVRIALGELLASCFAGNIEFQSIITSTVVNVLIASSVRGNDILKTAEGTMELIKGTARASSKRGLWLMLQGLLYRQLSRNLLGEIDWRRYCGAYLLGMKLPILKTHGRSDKAAFGSALERAADPRTLEIWRRLYGDPAILRWLNRAGTPQEVADEQ